MATSLHSASDTHDDGFPQRGNATFADIVEGWLRRWVFIVVVTAVGAGLGVTLALVRTPIYRSTAVIAYSAHGADSRMSGLLGGMGGLAGLIGVNLNAGGSRSEAVATLASRTIAEQFIQSNTLLPVLFSGEWDPATSTWKDQENIPSMDDAVRLFQRQVLNVVEDPVTGLITVNVDWRDPEIAAAWVNGLVKMADDHLRARDVADAKAALKYLEEQIKTQRVLELQQAIAGLVEAQLSQIMLASVRNNYALRVIDAGKASDVDNYVSPSIPLYGVAGALIGLLGALVFSIRHLFALRA